MTHLAEGKLLEESFRAVSLSEHEVRGDFHVGARILSGDERLERAEVLGISIQGLENKTCFVEIGDRPTKLLSISFSIARMTLENLRYKFVSQILTPDAIAKDSRKEVT